MDCDIWLGIRLSCNSRAEHANWPRFPKSLVTFSHINQSVWAHLRLRITPSDQLFSNTGTTSTSAATTALLSKKEYFSASAALYSFVACTTSFRSRPNYANESLQYWKWKCSPSFLPPPAPSIYHRVLYAGAEAAAGTAFDIIKRNRNARSLGSNSPWFYSDLLLSCSS